VPKGVLHVQSFKNITRYYRRFIEWFSKLAYPITSLQKKGIRFKWIEKCQEKFEKIKELLIITPILKKTDPQKDFLVCKDASLMLSLPLCEHGRSTRTFSPSRPEESKLFHSSWEFYPQSTR
jgi:hypothetical protein